MYCTLYSYDLGIVLFSIVRGKYLYAMRSAGLRVRIDLMLCRQKYVKSARLLCGSPYVETSFIFVSWYLLKQGA